MRRKIMISLVLSCVMLISGCLSGCGSMLSSDPISNEYVEVKKFKGLEVPIVEKTETTDETIDSTIEQNLAEMTTYNKVNRASKNGDQVNVDFVGKIDGKEFENGSAEGQDILIGAGNYIAAEGKYKGFEEQLIGHKAGEEFDIVVQFPKNYAENLAGKVATFTIKLNEVKEEVKAELTDDVVKKLSSTSTTVEEYRKEIKKQIEESNEETYNKTLEQEVCRELIANTKIIGNLEDEIEKYYNTMYESYENYATMYGVDMDTFCQSYMGMTEADFQKYMKKKAEENVAFKYACNLIADKAKLALSENEFKEEATKLAEEYGFKDSDETTEAAENSTEVKKSAYEQFIESYGEEEIRDYLTQKKVTEYLVANCKQTNEATTGVEETTDHSEETTTENKK